MPLPKYSSIFAACTSNRKVSDSAADRPNFTSLTLHLVKIIFVMTLMKSCSISATNINTVATNCECNEAWSALNKNYFTEQKDITNPWMNYEPKVHVIVLGPLLARAFTQEKILER
jgi:hypothetical protein